MLSAFLVGVLAVQNISEPRQWRIDGMLITEGDVTNCPYREVGQIKANVHGSFFRRPKNDTLITEIHERAVKLGADAVVRAGRSGEHSTVVWGRAKTITGLAIKFVAPCAAPQLVR